MPRVPAARAVVLGCGLTLQGKVGAKGAASLGWSRRCSPWLCRREAGAHVSTGRDAADTRGSACRAHPGGVASLHTCADEPSACVPTCTLTTGWKQGGRKGGEERKEAGGREGRRGGAVPALWSVLPPPSPSRGQRGQEARLREAVPSTTTGWHRRPWLATVRQRWWAVQGKPGRAA